jgi:DNA primase
MNRAARSRERINKDLPMLEVLVEYGYKVRGDGGDRTQNFSCDLHGDGKDSRPSAIYYPRSNSFHCFACARSRDSIALVMEKEGLKFWPAVRSLEKNFGLTPLPWEDEAPEERPPSLKEQIEESLRSDESLQELDERASRFLLNLTQERSLTPEALYKLWEVRDQTLFSIEKSLLTEERARALLQKVLTTSKELLTREGAD